jgi:hypothetical protein
LDVINPTAAQTVVESCHTDPAAAVVAGSSAAGTLTTTIDQGLCL